VFELQGERKNAKSLFFLNGKTKTSMPKEINILVQSREMWPCPFHGTKLTTKERSSRNLYMIYLEKLCY